MNTTTTTSEELINRIEDILRIVGRGEYNEYGLRVCGPVKVGDVLEDSRRWVDGHPTSECCEGTSTIGLRAGASQHQVDQALNQLAQYRVQGKTAVLVGAYRGRAGEDPAESLLDQPVVLKRWQ